MEKRNVTVHDLRKAKVIRSCTARRFDERLTQGTISAAEFNALLEFLQIDQLQCSLVLSCFRDPEVYFDTASATVASYARDLLVILCEQIAACDGSFEPLKQSLRRSAAEKAATLFVEHHKRVEQARSTAIL
jgi:hypothetical protein